jgi:uncharacterized protein
MALRSPGALLTDAEAIRRIIRMRLAEAEKEAILAAVRSFDSAAQVYLFGSRVDDGKKGGDIDLLILSGNIGRWERIKIRRMICDGIGERKIDILISEDASEPMARLALHTGVPLA